MSCLVANRLCGSRTSFRVVLRGEEESRPTLALFAFILGLSVVFTATLPFACGSDGGCSNRADVHISVGRGLGLRGANRISSVGDVGVTTRSHGYGPV